MNDICMLHTGHERKLGLKAFKQKDSEYELLMLD